MLFTQVPVPYSDVSVELPFVLMHPKPSEQPNSRPQSSMYAIWSLLADKHNIKRIIMKNKTKD